MENYTTEKELEDIVRQMGQNIRSGAQLAKLTNEINRYLNEESYLSETEDVLNESLFASLSIDPAAQFMRKEREYPNESMSIQSPIVSRKRRGKRSVYENVEFHNDFDEDNTRESLEAKSLIDQAWRSIHRAYETCRGATEIISRMSTEHSDHEQELSDEEAEDEDIAESVSVSVSSESNPSDVQKPKLIIMDPSVRPVRSPKPGRVPYKFDPVTRYHLYKTEWDRHPAPGEMRRLSLRWKVREFMLRHDVPRLTANQDGIVNHEKDWSPRPYMD